MEKVRFVFFGLVVGIVFFLQGVFALEGNHLIANSENWEDVYSVVLYSSLEGKSADFLTSTAHGPLLLNAITTDRSISIVTSEDDPFVFNYEPMVSAKGYPSVEEIEVKNANLELVDELENVKNFVIIDGSYGFSAIAVTPYAVQTNSWVFLADRINVAEIEAIIDRVGAGEVLVYGYVDREVSEVMEKYDPLVINTGDRFGDNIEIVKKYKEIKGTKQVLLSNGEFIEKEVVAGKHPVLFTGRDNVPDKIADYLKSSDISVGVLIGNELINAATNIRRSTGISVMVKFAQSARARSDSISQVEGLDLFYLPVPTISLSIDSIKYNTIEKQLEVTYHSESNIPIYLKGTITVLHDGDSERVGDSDPVFLAPNDFKTLRYPEIEIVDTGDIRAEVLALFGEVANSPDRQLSGSFEISTISVIDKCEIEVNKIEYNKQKESFFVTIGNVAGVDCYVDIELEDIEIDGFEQTIGFEGSKLIKASKKGKIVIPQRMEEVNVYLYFDLN